MTPEERARQEIDLQLEAAGWVVQDRNAVNLKAGRGVAVREFPTDSGPADYALFVDGMGIGAIEAKPWGTTLTGVEIQSDKYGKGFPEQYPTWSLPLPFLYESTGKVTYFTNTREPHYRSRRVFTFFRPETLADEAVRNPLREGLREMPPLIEDGLWPAQVKTIKNLEESLADNRPRALIQMATGSGKTFTAANECYRLIKHADARRVLFLVDRKNLGEQTLKEFQGFTLPDTGRKFVETYNVQHLKHGTIDDASRIVISTVQRLYSLLKEQEIDDETDEHSLYELGNLAGEPLDVVYNEHIPPETFDIIIVDECHRSIYNVWSQVLEYFDAFLIGLTATPSKQTFGYFKQNLVNSYSHADAVVDQVNVGYDVFPIVTAVTQGGATLNEGESVRTRDLDTGIERLKNLDDDLTYSGEQLDRAVVAEDQIRTVMKSYRDNLFTELFPGRSKVPKTLIFAKSDQHAEDIVRICREVFAEGNDFCQKITYRTTGKKPEDLISDFRNSFYPRIAVTVDMIATGTDIKPLEVVMFMRTVKSQNYFEQMKGRGVRIVDETTLLNVTPDATVKDRFVIVDAVGVCAADKGDSQPLIRKPSVSFDKLVESVAFGARDPEIVSTLAGRLARLEHKLTAEDHEELSKLTDGKPLQSLTRGLVDALSRDKARAKAVEDTGRETPTEEEVTKARDELIEEAVEPIAHNPEFRKTLLEVRARHEQTIDYTTQDQVLSAGFDQAAKERAQSTVADFEKWLKENKDELDAIQLLYSVPHKERPTYDQLKELANAISRPPRSWTPEGLWRAYEAVDKSKVKGSGGRMLTDLVSLVRFALHQQDELTPFELSVNEKFEHWLEQQKQAGREYTDEQVEWLKLIKIHIATSLGIDRDDFELGNLKAKGGLGAAWDAFGDQLDSIVDELNDELAA